MVPLTAFKTRLIRGAGLSLAIQLGSTLVGYITQIYLARWMGIQQYGIYVYIISWIGFLSVFSSFGFNASALRFIPQLMAHRSYGNVRGFLRVSRLFTFGSGAIIAVIAITVTQIFSNANVKLPLSVGLALLPVSALLILQSESIKGFNNIAWAYGPSLFMRSMLFLALAWLLERSSFKLTSLVVVLLYCIVLVTVYGVQFIGSIKVIPKWLRSKTRSYSTQLWVRVSLTLLLVSGFQVLLNQTDLLLLGMFRTTSEVAAYSVAVRVSTVISFVLIAVNNVVAPSISSLYHTQRYTELQKLLLVASHWVLWPSVFLGAMFILARHTIVDLFGSGFIIASFPLVILIIGQLFNAGCGSVAYLLNLTGYHKKSALVYGVTAGFNIVANIFAIRAWGVIGASIVTATSMIAWNLVLHSIVVKNVHLYPSFLSYYWNRILERRKTNGDA